MQVGRPPVLRDGLLTVLVERPVAARIARKIEIKAIS